jgi:hypothetical protein
MAGMKRRFLKLLAGAALLLFLLGVAGPFVRADRYRARVQSSLSTALGRKVSIQGHVSFSLFTGPALALGDVTISEADSSAEPFAYVDEVRAIPRLYSLWTGHLEFSSLTLEGAHVNLVRYIAGTTPSWNFEPLLSPGLLAAFPTIHVRDSRINFVLEDRKSPFYLLDADLDVNPLASDGTNWSVGFEGAPARSDRPARGFGAIHANGTWRRTGENGRLALDIRLARSEMSDILSLVYGRDVGIHGIVSGQAHIAGLMRALGIEGEMRVSELHGWEQSPPESGVFPFRVSGTLDTPAQHLELFAQPRSKQQEWMMHLIAQAYLERPLLQVEFRSDGLPIAPLPGLLRNFGVNLPDGLQLTGAVNGAVGFDSREGWSGSANISKISVGLPDGTPIEFQQCAFAIDGSHVAAGPVQVSEGAEAFAEATASYSIADGAFEVKLTSSNAPLGTLSQRFPGMSIPLLSQIHSGAWTGELTYSQPAGGEGAWRGEGDLTDASVALPALSQPVGIAEGHLQFEGEDLRLDHLVMSAGNIDLQGAYSYRHSDPVPHEFHLVAARADLPAIEALLHPLLNHGGSLLDRALGRPTEPPWLMDAKASGTLQIDTLDAVAAELSRVRGNVAWSGERIAITGLVMHDGPAVFSGVFNLDLKNPKPHYSGAGTWSNLEWKGGLVSGTLAQLETSGTGLETLTNLKARGELTGEDLTLEPLGAIEKLTGTYNLAWSGSALRIRFPALKLQGDGGEVWTGSGSAQGADGQVTLRPAGGRQINLAGSLTDASRDWVER